MKLHDMKVLFRRLVSLPIVLVWLTAETQVTNAVEQVTSVKREILPERLIPLLRDGDIQQALEQLGAFADDAPSVSLGDDHGLSTVCASLHRALSQMTSEEQFDLLKKWSLPAGTTPRIRILSALVPTIAPPTEFARALGERPRNSSFSIASIGEVSGIFSTAWSLVASARDSGRLKHLINELTPLVNKKILNSELLMALAQIADTKGDPTKLNEELNRRSVELKRTQLPTKEPSQPVDPMIVILACAASGHPDLRAIGVEILGRLAADSDKPPTTRLHGFLCRAHARAILPAQMKRSETSPASKSATQFKYWLPVSENLEGLDSLASDDAIWLAHEDHLLHLAGSKSDMLMLRFPLQGDFQFECEARFGDQKETNGGLNFDGLGFQVVSSNQMLRITDTGDEELGTRFCPFLRPQSSPAFNRLFLTSTSSSLVMAVNLHPMWTDRTNSQSSPWLGLTCLDESRSMFRNLRLTGRPVIPRSVKMSDADSLRGWRTQSSIKRTEAIASTNSDWRIAQGIIQAGKRDSKSSTTDSDQLLSYQRPLLAGESVDYEFFYKPGEVEVSPTIGRVVLLLEPEGIRIRWITDSQPDWTGIAPDNAVAEPLNRRGPRPLPFKNNDWNRVTLSRTEAGISLSLNGVEIYVRPVDWTTDCRFGLYRHQENAGVQVRNVVMKGDWPESLPQDFFENPTATSGEPLKVAERHALNRIFQDQVLEDNVLTIRRQAFALPVPERFKFLSKWILPSPDHPTFRVAGDFTQSQPASIAFEPGVTDPELGGQIVSPVFDWIDAAKELGKLTECRAQVEAVSIPDGDDKEYQLRAKLALLLLLDLQLGDPAVTVGDYEAFFSLVKTQTSSRIQDQWPETLVVDQGARKYGRNAAIRELISSIHAQRAVQWRPDDSLFWQAHIISSYSRILLVKAAESTTPFTSLGDWIVGTAAYSRSRGQGYPTATWIRNVDKVTKLACHERDFLFYRQPLTGNYEVDCDFEDNTWVMTAGRFVGPRGDGKLLYIGAYRTDDPGRPIEQPLTPFHSMRHLRTAIHDGTRTTWINGREVLTEKLNEAVDPWIAIYCWGKNSNGIQNFRISGQPKVLDVVPLSDSKNLTGWISYHEEAVIEPRWAWIHVDDPESSGWIVGQFNGSTKEAFNESLLRYQRPLVEDGSIEYEFFYEPGKLETYPALDRLALILHPSGVREHWITDARYDRTLLAPNNMTDSPSNRRGPSELPLKSGQWNSVALRLQGSNLSMELNGTLIYERELEQSNQRTFGLFHYSDFTEVRVRNASMRGDWPKSLPELTDQELASHTVESLDADLPRLKSTFTRDFRQGSLPDKHFTTPSPSGKMGQNANGIGVSLPAKGGWIVNSIAPRFKLSGDFDIEVSFTDFVADCDKDSVILLSVMLDDERQPDYRMIRTRTADRREEAQAQRTLLHADGNRSYHTEVKPFEVTSGRLRLARRGKKLFFLVAEGDSENFRLIETEAVSDAPTPMGGVHLEALSNGVGSTQVVWTNLTMRAESLEWKPETPDGLVEKLDADLPNLKSVFARDFLKEVVPDQYVSILPTRNSKIVQSSEGIQVSVTAAGGWDVGVIVPRFSMSGDFDVEAGFKQFVAESDQDAAILLSIMLGDERLPDYRIVRTRTSDQRHDVLAQKSFRQPNGNRSYEAEPRSSAAMNGRLRIARRGHQIYYLLAENDSQTFRLIDTFEISNTDTVKDGIRLETLGHGLGLTQVIWTNVIMRATSMTWYPDKAAALPEVLNVMQADGSGLRTICRSDAVGFTNIGSIAWSADGRKIVMEMSNGAAAKSHIFTIDSDGGQQKDLGLGSLPSFSSDSSQIVFSQPDKGIILMKTDGSDRQVLDSKGWGASWSPDGKSIAYGKAGNLHLMDVKTRKSRQLLEGSTAARYNEFRSPLGWSHDSRFIAFKNRLRNSTVDELAIVDVNSPKGFKVLLPNANAIRETASWSTDNKQLLVVFLGTVDYSNQLRSIDSTTPGLMRMYPTPAINQKITGCAWSPDGRSIAVSGQPAVSAIEWTTGPNSDAGSR